MQLAGMVICGKACGMRNGLEQQGMFVLEKGTFEGWGNMTGRLLGLFCGMTKDRKGLMKVQSCRFQCDNSQHFASTSQSSECGMMSCLQR